MDDFEKFVENLKYGLDNGIFAVSGPLSEFDLAVQYAVMRLTEEKGVDYMFSVDELERKMEECFGRDGMEAMSLDILPWDFDKYIENNKEKNK